jgi:hypothetical protein
MLLSNSKQAAGCCAVTAITTSYHLPDQTRPVQLWPAAAACPAAAHLLQYHQHNLGLHRVHAAADTVHAQLAHSQGKEHHKATREAGSLTALQQPTASSSTTSCL